MPIIIENFTCGQPLIEKNYYGLKWGEKGNV